jgi:hypothetical protein
MAVAYASGLWQNERLQALAASSRMILDASSV